MRNAFGDAPLQVDALAEQTDEDLNLSDLADLTPPDSSDALFTMPSPTQLCVAEARGGGANASGASQDAFAAENAEYLGLLLGENQSKPNFAARAKLSLSEGQVEAAGPDPHSVEADKAHEGVYFTL